MKTQVAVGLSGGIDSAVSAWLLKQQGYDVIGLFMRNWVENEENGFCSAQKDFEDVARVCDKIDIPYYALDFSKEYQDRVFQHFVQSYENGLTPNPDILCNREIKFHVFLEKALALGASFLATGHYAKTENALLMTAKDHNKDQTYFLYTLNSEILKKVKFPLSDLLKPQVRQIGREIGLCVSEKKDSTGICFIGERPFREFLAQYLPSKPGLIVNSQNQTIGEHLGVSFYTIGQRKGIQINKKKDDQNNSGEAWFVAKKDAKNNTLLCVQGSEHPYLYAQTLFAAESSWVQSTPCFPFHCTAKARYRQKAQPCIVSQTNDILKVDFTSPQKALTPGQSIVFYDDHLVLGGAVIQKIQTCFD
jgi:tRNA-specific 2-thiouridylase